MGRFGITVTGIVICLFGGAAFAGGGTLTNGLAQRALDQWASGNGTKNVMGVLEIPSQNAARADITLSNFKWNSPRNDAVTAYAFGPGGGSHVYSGQATAHFIHYTDGRWVLVEVRTPMGSFGNLNIVAGKSITSNAFSGTVSGSSPCKRPKKPKVVDGDAATNAQIQRSRQAVVAFMAASGDYQNCLLASGDQNADSAIAANSLDRHSVNRQYNNALRKFSLKLTKKNIAPGQ